MRRKGRFFEARIALARRLLSSASGLRLLTRAMPSRIRYVGIESGNNIFLSRPVDGVGRVLLMKGEWFARETEAILAFALRKRPSLHGRAALEVGGHIGTQSVQFARSGLFSTVIVAEPNPENNRLLRANLVLNDLADRVAVFGYGIDTAPRKLKLFAHEFNSGAGSLVFDGDSRSDSGILVPVETVETLLRECGLRPEEIGFAWIDSEGMEYEVLTSCLDAGVRPQAVALEYSPTIYGPEKSSRLCDLIERQFSEIHFVAGEDIRPLSSADLRAITRQTDLILLA